MITDYTFNVKFANIVNNPLNTETYKHRVTISAVRTVCRLFYSRHNTQMSAHSAKPRRRTRRARAESQTISYACHFFFLIDKIYTLKPQ